MICTALDSRLILDGDQADATVLIVDHQQLLDAMLVQHPLRLVLADALAHRDQVFVRHQFGNLLAHVGGETNVAVGQDTDQLARHALAGARHHRDAGDAVILHQAQCVGERSVRRNGQRIDHHAGFILLDLTHLGGLAVDIEIAVDHADAAGLRHGDRHPRFGHGVHRRGDNRNVQRNGAGDAGADIGFGRQDVGEAGLQQHVIECVGFAYSVQSLHQRHRQLPSAACRRDRP
jgi:hypothetical protein